MSSMQRWSGRVAVVTGASSGIGRTLVHTLLKNNMKVRQIAFLVNRSQVAGCGRRKEKLESLVQDVGDAADRFLPIVVRIQNALSFFTV